MRILQVIHQYPPFSCQGSEVYCQQLSRCLSEAGDHLGVFHISNTRPRRPKRLDKRVEAGIVVFHAVDAGEYSRLADWPNPFLQNAFRRALQEFRPDVVHFHHDLSLGDELVGLAKASGAAVVYTLHDFGLICPNRLLLRNTGELCDKSTPEFFGACCPQLIRTGHGRRPRLASQIPSLARWRQFAVNQPSHLRRLLLQAAVAVAERLLGAPELTSIEAKQTFYQSTTARIFTQVDLFLSPSRFLHDRYIACGVKPSSIHYLRYGIRPFACIKRETWMKGLHFGYIGAFHAHKGIELLLEAFRGLGDRATLHLYGSSFDSPVSEAHFRRATADPIAGVVLHGAYANAQVAEILSGLDAVIVPSLWFENSPLTIQEAQIAGVPVITAEVGGMAELVRDGIDGLLFRFGDSQDLRRLLLGLIEAPDRLAELRAQAPDVPTIEEQALQVRRCYQSVRARTTPGSAATHG